MQSLNSITQTLPKYTILHFCNYFMLLWPKNVVKVTENGMIGLSSMSAAIMESLTLHCKVLAKCNMKQKHSENV